MHGKGLYYTQTITSIKVNGSTFLKSIMLRVYSESFHLKGPAKTHNSQYIKYDVFHTSASTMKERSQECPKATKPMKHQI